MNIYEENRNMFHVSLLKPDPQNPLPSQVQDNIQPPPITVESEEKCFVEAIVDERRKRDRG